jgi:transposase InsO family protein
VPAPGIEPRPSDSWYMKPEARDLTHSATQTAWPSGLGRASATAERDDNFFDAVNSRDKLIQLQRGDETLANLYSIVQPETDETNGRALFYLNDGILMRKWREKTVPNVAGTACSQIAVPKVLPPKLLYLAHDIPLSAHLSITKTKARLESHFYWPTLTRDVKQYVKTCDMCQRVGKSGKPVPALLQNLPLVTEPFKRIAIECPLPTGVETGNRFILTIIDLCTHYVEAIALKSHEAPIVAKALITVFSHFGFPEEILSDQGPEVMSKMMRIFLKEFGIRHVQTRPYHPQCNGSCERFNGTMKAMLRSLSEQYPENWDQTIPWILFACREVPVETLGFSPFELLFGRHVPGPLSLVKKAWLHASRGEEYAPKSIVQFVVETRERLRDAITLASEHVNQQKAKSKAWYDKKARARAFEEGQEVLALLPLRKNPL